MTFLEFSPLSGTISLMAWSFKLINKTGSSMQSDRYVICFCKLVILMQYIWNRWRFLTNINFELMVTERRFVPSQTEKMVYELKVNCFVYLHTLCWSCTANLFHKWWWIYVLNILNKIFCLKISPSKILMKLMVQKMWYSDSVHTTKPSQHSSLLNIS
jgi:hypothetical protein